VKNNIRLRLSSNSTMVFVVALTALAACTPPEQKAKAYYESGQKYLDQKDYVKAALEFRNALKVKQDYPDAWFGMAQVEENDKNWNLVSGDLQKVLELDPKYNKARLALARLLMLGGNFDQALKNISIALEQEPKDASVHSMKAAILLKLGKTHDAVQEANSALTLDPGSADALMILAAERLGANDNSAVQSLIDKGLEISPKSVGLQLFALSYYQKIGNLAAQESTLRNIGAIEPGTPNYRKALVTFLMSQKRYDDAEDELRAIAASDPKNVQANLEVVSFLASYPGKGPDEAAKELAKLIAAGESSTTYKSALAQLYFELGRNEDSFTLLKDVIEKEGITEMGMKARVDLAAKYIGARKIAEAEPVVAEVLKNDTRNIEGLRLRAAIEIEQGKLDAAANDLRTAMNDAPGNPLLYQMMAAVDERGGSIELAEKSMSDAFRVGRYDAKIGLDLARFLLRHGKAERAESILTDLAQSVPNRIDVISMLADLKLRRQDWRGAQDLAEVIKNTPGNEALSGQVLAASLSGQNKIEDSIQVLLLANAANPNQQQTKFALVQAYLKIGKYAKAEDYLNTLLKSDPSNVEARVFLGVVQSLTKRPDDALASFNAAMKTDPKNPSSYKALSQFYAQSGKMDEAIQALKNGLVQIPKDMDLRFVLASIYQGKNEIDGAIKLYEEMLADQPSSMIAANNYASLVSDNRTDAASIDKAAAAAAILRGSPISQFKDTLGWILFLRGQYKDSLEILKQSTADLPDMALTNYHSGKAYLATGEKNAAKLSFQRALKLARNDQEKQLAEQGLKDVDAVSLKKN
jgi:cellulose synthase operon protein C